MVTGYNQKASVGSAFGHVRRATYEVGVLKAEADAKRSRQALIQQPKLGEFDLYGTKVTVRTATQDDFKGIKSLFSAEEKKKRIALPKIRKPSKGKAEEKTDAIITDDGIRELLSNGFSVVATVMQKMGRFGPSTERIIGMASAQPVDVAGEIGSIKQISETGSIPRTVTAQARKVTDYDKVFQLNFSIVASGYQGGIVQENTTAALLNLMFEKSPESIIFAVHSGTLPNMYSYTEYARKLGFRLFDSYMPAPARNNHDKAEAGEAGKNIESLPDGLKGPARDGLELIRKRQPLLANDKDVHGERVIVGVSARDFKEAFGQKLEQLRRST